MILNKTELKKITSSDHIYKYSFGLTVSDVEELIGTPVIESGRVNNVSSKNVEMYQDLWQLSPDTYYIRFNESVTLKTSQSAILLPHINAMKAGATIYPRTVVGGGNSQMRAVFRPNRRMKLAPDTPVATMVVFDESE